MLEVETPALSHTTVTDVHLSSFSTEFVSPVTPEQETLYLQTSPEYAMKRLLCAGSGPIYQICKSFRNEESGKMHNPEFTMLEWYRPGFDHFDLMNEVAELVQLVLGCQSIESISYQEAFNKCLGLDPLAATNDEVKQFSIDLGFGDIANQVDDKDTLLQLLFVEKIESVIGVERPCFVYGYPASQSALARISQTDERIADRFELYFKGVELANGFYELTDANEQHLRFLNDNAARQAMGLDEKPIDKRLLSALEAGLPDCAGVALGLDRVIMLALGLDRIEQAISFGIDRA